MIRLLELRHAIRGLLRTPVFTSVAVITLAIGIGATAMVYSYVAAIFAASSPPSDLEQSVGLWSCPVSQGDQKGVVSPRDYLEWRRRARAFDRMGAFRRTAFNLGGVERPSRVDALEIAGDYLALVDEPLLMGRGFSPQDERAGAYRVALVGERFWRRELHGDPAVVGRVLRLDGNPTKVVGVLRAKPLSPDLVVPVVFDEASGDHAARSLFVFARRRADVSLEQARAEMRSVGQEVDADRPAGERGWGVNTRPLSEEFIGLNARIVFGILLAAVTAVLLIGCANIASLTLARGMSRQRALAIRAALGASRFRLAAQTLTESMIVAAAGGLLGALLASAGLSLLRSSATGVSEAVANVELGWRVLLFSGAASVLAAVASGLVPALQSSRIDLERTLREGGTWVGGGGGRRFRVLLVAGEVTLSVALLVVAGLLLRTLVALQSVEPGFEARGVLTARVTLPEPQFPSPEHVTAFLDDVLATVGAHPAVVTASAATRVPASGSRHNPNRSLVVEGRVPREGEGLFAADLGVTPGFFATIGIPLLDGRDFSDRDTAASPLVAVVNATMARKYWAGRSPIGGRLRLGDEGNPASWRLVVGVVGDVRNDDIDAPPVPHVYVPLAQRPERTVTFVTKTRGDPAALAAPLRGVVAARASDVPLFDMASMEEVVRRDLADTRMLVQVLLFYAAAALVLAAVGVGGVLAQTVSQRVPEIGVRVALGGSRLRVVWGLLRPTLGAAAAGLIIGLVFAAALGQVIGGLLYQVEALDPLTYAAVVLALALSASAAAIGPALRAANVDPVVALRGEAGR